VIKGSTTWSNASTNRLGGTSGYSLISAPTGGAVSVHRLVQAITLARLPAGRAAGWQQAAAALITAALPGDPQLPANWRSFATLLPHVLAALPLTSEPTHRAAAYLGCSGSYTAARDLQQQILTARREDLGVEDPRHPAGSRRNRLLDRTYGGCGRGPGPIRCAVARRGAGFRREGP